MTGARVACNLWDHTELHGRKTITSIQYIIIQDIRVPLQIEVMDKVKLWVQFLKGRW